MRFGVFGRVKINLLLRIVIQKSGCSMGECHSRGVTNMFSWVCASLMRNIGDTEGSKSGTPYKNSLA